MASLPSAVIRGLAIHLPAALITNEELAAGHPDWDVEKIASKTGIDVRHKVADGETGLDIAEAAARSLLAEGVPSGEGSREPIDPASIDTLLYCTQSPDYLLPTNACMLQDRLGLPTSAMAFDYNLGCSGYVYGLALAKGLIASGQSRRILLVTTETLSRYMDEDDRSVRTLFGDAATASLIDAGDDAMHGGHIGASVYGTDGSGAAHLHVTGIGYDGSPMDERSAGRGDGPKLFMDGPEVFAFALKVVPGLMQQLYERGQTNQDAIDLFIFHQANRYMLENLRRKLRIPAERFVVELADVGNTSSNTIPIALHRAQVSGRIQPGQSLALVGFGVGLSWGAVLVDWR